MNVKTRKRRRNAARTKKQAGGGGKKGTPNYLTVTNPKSYAEFAEKLAAKETKKTQSPIKIRRSQPITQTMLDEYHASNRSVSNCLSENLDEKEKKKKKKKTVRFYPVTIYDDISDETPQVDEPTSKHWPKAASLLRVESLQRLNTTQKCKKDNYGNIIAYPCKHKNTIYENDADFDN